MLAAALVQNGARVYITARKQAECARTADELNREAEEGSLLHGNWERKRVETFQT